MNRLKLGYIFAAFIILVAIAVSTVPFLTPVFDTHRVAFEQKASEFLHMPVTIYRARFSWYRYQPVVSFDQVTILNKDTKQPVLEIQKMRIFFSLFKSIWQRTLVPNGVMIVGSSINVHHANGEWRLQGFPALGGFNNPPLQNESNSADILNWLSSLPFLTLENINVRYTNDNHVVRNATLDNLVLKNSGIHHVIQGKAILHQDIETTLSMAIKWKGEKVDLDQISANAYFYVAGIRLTQWLKDASWNNWQIKNGLATTKLWIAWRQGTIKRLQSIFEVYGLSLYSAKDQSTHLIERASGHIGWKRENDKEVLAGNDILLDFPSHLWPATSFYLSFKLNPDGAPSFQAMNMGYIDLNDIKPYVFASTLLPDDMQQMLNSLKLSGTLQNITLMLNGPLDLAHLTVFNTQFDKLNFSAINNFPGFTNLSGEIKSDSTKGVLSLNSKNMQMDYNTLFAKPLSIDEVQGKINLARDDSGHAWRLETEGLQIQNPNINSKWQGKLTVPDKDPMTIDLLGEFSLQNLNHLATSLPTQILDPDLNHWLATSFLTGGINAGRIIFRGQLQAGFLDNNKNLFMATGQLDKVGLKFADDWPAIDNIQGHLTFTGRQMLVDIDSAESKQVPLTKVHGVIPYLGSKEPAVLTIKSAPINTDFAAALKYVHASPLEKHIGKAFANAEMQGPLMLTLSLNIPLDHPDQTKSNGMLDFKDADMSLIPWHLMLTKLNGQIQFTDQTISGQKIQALLFNKPIQFDIATITNAQNQTIIHTTFANDLSVEELEDWFKYPLAKYLSGHTMVNGQIDISNDLPLKIGLQSTLQGVAINLPSTYGKTATETKNLAINITSGQPPVFQIDYADVDLAISPFPDHWQVKAKSDAITGDLSIPREFTSKNVLTATLDQLKINLANSSPQQTFSHIDIKSLPMINLDAKDLSYNDMDFGHVTLKTSSHPTGLAIDTLQVDSPSFTLNAKGKWDEDAKGDHTYIEGVLSSENLDGFLNEFDVPTHNVVLTSGRVTFNLDWPNKPFAPDIGNLDGSVNLHTNKGRIISIGTENDAKMDLGRMLTLFSLQSLPRRLSLDFSDITKKGYSFDTIQGDFKLHVGNVQTNNFTINGPVASVGMDGRIGLSDKDYDLTVSVMPHDVTSGIPIAVAIFGTPLAGLAALAVNTVIGSQISKATAHYYQVTGPWANPTWKSINVVNRN